MTSGPEEPFRGTEYPAYPPVDYPADAGLPPPVYPPPVPGPAGYPGYGQPTGYPPYPYHLDPYDPYRPAAPYKPPGTNGKAIAALVTALAGLLCCGLPSVAGLILGVIAMRETRRTGQDGYGIALAGAIIGGLLTAFFALYLLITLILTASGFQYG